MTKVSKVILTSYFTGKEDPQHKFSRPTDNDDLLRPWCESIQRLGLAGIIFHDRLSTRFTKKWRSFNIRFVRYPLQTSWSVNDERFLAWRNFLVTRTDLTHVLLSDLFDIVFNRDPFYFMQSRVARLFTGDIGGKVIGSKKSGYVNSKLRLAYGGLLFPRRKVLTAGLAGGSFSDILLLLEEMVQDFRRLDSSLNLNMGVFNRCAHSLFGDSIFCGPPLNSPLKRNSSNKEFYVKHK